MESIYICIYRICLQLLFRLTILFPFIRFNLLVLNFLEAIFFYHSNIIRQGLDYTADAIEPSGEARGTSGASLDVRGKPLS